MGKPFHTAHRWELEWQDDVDVLSLRSGVQVKVFYSDPELGVVFFQCPGTVLALWGRDELAADSGVVDGGGWGGCTPAQNVRSAEEVDAVIEQASVAVPREAVMAAVAAT